MAPPPELIEELVEEVLLRFPPDDPASLVRAALVCKLWCRLVCGTAFRRRFREFHRGAAPLLGVLYSTTGQGVGDDDTTPSWSDDDDTDRRPMKRARILLPAEPIIRASCFVPATSYRPANGHRNDWRAIDAHHGRVLLSRQSNPLALSVWDPLMDEQRHLPEVPLVDTLGYSAAVVCAAAAGDNCCCDYLDCHRGPFLVVAIEVDRYNITFSVYSSESGAWSNPTDLEHQAGYSPGTMKHTPAVLVGSALHFLVHFTNEIVRFDLATEEVDTVYLPSEFHLLPSIVLMTGDDGELGFAASTRYQLKLWSVLTGEDDGVVFVPRRVIDLHEVLPSDALISCSPRVNGFADCGDSRFLFMMTSDGLYSIEVNSSDVSKVAKRCCGADEDEDVVPYISFCTPTSKYNFGDDACPAGASPDARPTTATVVDSQYDGLRKIVPRRRPRTQNPRFYGPEWANN